MVMRSRPYQGDEDARLLVEVVVAATARDPQCSFWHAGDVWWGLYQNTVDDPREGIRLWLDGGDTVGFAWLSPPGSVSLAVHPDVADPDALEEEMLAWAEERRRALPPARDGLSALAASAFEHDTRRIALLERRGYQRTGLPLYHFHRSLSAPIAPTALPAEVTVRHVDGEDEWAERVALHREVWEPSRVTLEAYRRLRACAGYTPELDLVAALPGRNFGAYCICWLDSANRSGEFEPVGTRPAFRRQGLARAVLVEGLRRLQALGAEHAIVYTPAFNAPAVALYESVGFQRAGNEHTYVRQV